VLNATWPFASTLPVAEYIN